MSLRRRLCAVALAAAALAAARPAAAQCTAPEPVCRARTGVVAVSAFDPMASAVVLGPRRLATNRHVVADRETAKLHLLPDGPTVEARVVPTSYPGDLVLLRAARDLGRPALESAAAAGGPVYTVAVDVGARAVTAAGPGEVAARPPAGKPRARLHHSAPARKGNSGGALVDAAGRLIGVVTAGGEGRNNAIPAAELERLAAMSGPGHAEAHARLGRAYRRCITGLEGLRGPPPPRLVEACEATGNRELWDRLGQALGRAGRHRAAARLFRRSLDADPNSTNSRLSLAVTLHLAGRSEAEVPVLKRLLEALPADFQVLRMAVQAARETGDRALGDRALALIERHHPQALPQARAFLRGEPPPETHDGDSEETSP